MNAVPLSVGMLFGATTFLAVFLFCKAVINYRPALLILLVWLAIQTIVGLTGFYTKTYVLPPRFALLIGPPLLIVAALFVFPRGRVWLDKLDPELLTLLHVVRIPVELILLTVFLYGMIPQLMTFEGRNFDVLSGLTAPLVWFFGYKRKQLSRLVLIVWNLICLGLLINIVVHAILSAPFPFQQLAFDQPNMAVLYFPYIWLPCCIVPLVLLSHLAELRRLFRKTAA